MNISEEKSKTASKETKSPKRAAKPKSESYSLEKKLKEIESSNLPEREKMRYKKMLSGPEVVKTGVPFDVYASIRELRGGERAAKAAFAVSKGKLSLSKKEWDELFRNF